MKIWLNEVEAMDQKSVDEHQYRLAIDAAKIYYMMYRTAAILAGRPPQKIGMSLGPAVYQGLRWI